MEENYTGTLQASRLKLRQFLLSAFFAALMAAGAMLTIPIPYVPITMQSFIVLMSGLLLGPWYGALSQIFYIVLGLIGLPIFAGGTGGLHRVFSPTFGFLIGFIFASFAAGFFAPKDKNAPWWRFSISGFMATFVLYLVGLPLFWLNMNYITAPDTGITFIRAVQVAFVPFILPDSIKALAAGWLAKRTKAVID